MRFEILKFRSAHRTFWGTDCGPQTSLEHFGHVRPILGYSALFAIRRPVWPRLARHPVSQSSDIRLLGGGREGPAVCRSIIRAKNLPNCRHRDERVLYRPKRRVIRGQPQRFSWHCDLDCQCSPTRPFPMPRPDRIRAIHSGPLYRRNTHG